MQVRKGTCRRNMTTQFQASEKFTNAPHASGFHYPGMCRYRQQAVTEGHKNLHWFRASMIVKISAFLTVNTCQRITINWACAGTGRTFYKISELVPSLQDTINQRRSNGEHMSAVYHQPGMYRYRRRLL